MPGGVSENLAYDKQLVQLVEVRGQFFANHAGIDGVFIAGEERLYEVYAVGRHCALDCARDEEQVLLGRHGNHRALVDGGVHFLQELLYGIAQRAVDGFVVLEVGVRAVVVDVLGHVAEWHDERRAEERKLLVRVGIVKVLVQKLAELDAPRVEIEQYAKDVGNEFCLVLRRHQLAASAHSYLRLAKLRVAVIARQSVLENIHKPRIARDCLHEGGNLALAEQIFCLAHDVARVDKRLYGLVALGVSDVLVCHLTVSP